MAILVLGGAGYIGSHTVYELIDAGRDVVIADNLETGHIEAVHPKAKFYQGDIRNREFVDSVFESELLSEREEASADVAEELLAVKWYMAAPVKTAAAISAARISTRGERCLRGGL